MTNQVSERAHTHMRFDCNVQAAAAAAGAVATADASPLRVRESVSPGFGKERMHSALGCVEHTRRCYNTGQDSYTELQRERRSP